MDLDEVEDKTADPSVRDNSMKCDFCEELFMNRQDLMFHNKKEHEEKVQICWNFKKGNCLFGDSNCWFLHTFSMMGKFTNRIMEIENKVNSIETKTLSVE